MQPALLIEHVSKRYSGHLAVRDLSLAMPAGTVYGILGPNGAGKSTTLRMALNIIGRDTGRVALLGRDPERDREVLRKVGYLPEERGLYRKMEVLDTIVFFARLKGMPAPAARREGERWLERMGLGEWRRRRVEALSKGMQQKVQFIATVIHEPELLVLDEPASGLDPLNQEVLRDAIVEARQRGRTVIFSTHNMAQAEELCEQVCIIAGGEKVLDGSLREIRRQHRGNRFALEAEEPAEALRRFVAGSPLLSDAAPTPEGWTVELRAGAEPRELLAALLELGVTPSRFEHLRPTLHEIFVERVRTAAGASASAAREAAHA